MINYIFRNMDPAATPAEMRAAIEKAQMDSPLVRNTLMTARFNGLSAEDTYTILAYHALQQYISMAQHVMELNAMMPPPIIVRKGEIMREDVQPLADALYTAGYQDRHNERDYDPRGTAEWQAVVDVLDPEPSRHEAPVNPAKP